MFELNFPLLTFTCTDVRCLALKIRGADTERNVLLYHILCELCSRCNFCKVFLHVPLSQTTWCFYTVRLLDDNSVPLLTARLPLVPTLVA